MKRRRFLEAAGSTSLLSLFGARPTASLAATTMRRVRPADAAWPSPALWDALNARVGGQLIKVPPLLEACAGAPGGAACDDVLRNLRNPYFIGEQPAGTQTFRLGRRLAVVAKRVRGGREEDGRRRGRRGLRAHAQPARRRERRRAQLPGHVERAGLAADLDAADDAITLHEAFTPAGCVGKVNPSPAVSVQAGARWLPVYNAVTTKAGRYVQGGGCATVGVAGLVTGGGFGSFSKHYGMAAAGLLEAEVVTADGAVRIANACTHPDLFWALKGAGGGSFGVVTRLTMRTRETPEFFGGVLGTIQATSDAAFRRLIARFTSFYAEALFNPRWGESVYFRPDNTLVLGMVFHGSRRRRPPPCGSRSSTGWRRRSRITRRARRCGSSRCPRVTGGSRVPAPEPPRDDPRRRAARCAGGSRVLGGQPGRGGILLHGYESAWLPASLLERGQQARFNDAVFAGSRHWKVSLHFNKGLAGAPPEAVKEARDMSMNPAVTSAFALAIVAAAARRRIRACRVRGRTWRRRAAMPRRSRSDRRAAQARAGAGSYVSEAGFFDPDWRRGYWGRNYARLLAVKKKYDPDGLFIVHHGVGSEFWSADGCTRVG